MAKSNIYTPEGVQDFLYKSCNNKRRIEKGLRELFASFGYKEIETPIIEFYDVFTRSNTSYRVENMFKILDEKGRVLVLKPDQTIPVARVAATKLIRTEDISKVSYIADTFRFDEQGGGKQRQFTQAGCEIINENSIIADAEIITIAIKSLLDNGIEEFQIDIGNVDVFRGLLEETGFDQDKIEEIRRLIDIKDFIGLEEIFEDTKIDKELIKSVIELPKSFGDIDMIDKVKSRIKNKKALLALDKLKDIYKVLDEYGFGKYISLDLGMVSGLDYYTGLIFKGYTYEVGFPILSGGRYDKLLSQFGKEMCAVGFSVGVNFLMMARQRQNLDTHKDLIDTFVSYGEDNYLLAYEISKSLRKQNIKVEQGLRSMSIEETKKYCEKKEIKGYIYIKARNEIKVADLTKNSIINTSMDELT